MSKRAEERALEAYPYNRAITSNDVEYDGNFCNRLPYTEGYEQAEQDLALTAEDVSCIYHLCGQFNNDFDKVAKVFNKDREEERHDRTAI